MKNDLDLNAPLPRKHNFSGLGANSVLKERHSHRGTEPPDDDKTVTASTDGAELQEE